MVDHLLHHQSGFVNKGHSQFVACHGSVVDKCGDSFDSELQGDDHISMSKACEHVLGRYCKMDIQNVTSFQHAIELNKAVARAMSLKRTVKLGKQVFLAPTPETYFPIILIETSHEDAEQGSEVYGFLAYRIGFSPLEVDWIRCLVEKVDGSFWLQPKVDTFPDTSRLVFETDTMNEFAVWFSIHYQSTWKCKLFMSYEINTDPLWMILTPQHPPEDLLSMPSDTSQSKRTVPDDDEKTLHDACSYVEQLLKGSGYNVWYKVNVQTGRSGYHKRVQAMDKTVEQRAHVYSGDLELNDTSADQHFKMSMKEVLPQHDSLDLSGLLLFSSAPTPQRLAIEGTSKTHLFEEDTKSHRPAASTPCEIAGPVDEANSSSDDEKPSSSSNPFTAMRFALPKNKAAAKAKTKAAAKAVPKRTPSVKGEGTTRQKRKVETEDPEHSIHKLGSGPKIPKGTDTDESDAKLIQEFEAKIKTMKSTLLASILETDSGSIDGLRSASKEIVSFLSQLKLKAKSVGRRKDKESAKIMIDFLVEQQGPLMELSSVCSGLIALSGEDTDHLDALQKFREDDWSISAGVYKRAFKCACISHLKFGSWTEITGPTRNMMLSLLGKENGEEFFFVMLNDCIQRLVRAVPATKVTLKSEELNPLRSLLTHLAETDLVRTHEGLSKNIKHILIILQTESHTSQEITNAVSSLQDSAESNEGMGLAAVIVGLSTGKALLRQSRQFAEHHQKEMAFLGDLSSTCEELSNMTIPTEPHDSWQSFADTLHRGLKQLMDATAASKANPESAKGFLSQAKKSMSEFVVRVCRSYTTLTISTWLRKFNTLWGTGSSIGGPDEICFNPEENKFNQLNQQSNDVVSVTLQLQSVLKLVHRTWLSFKDSSLNTSDAIQTHLKFDEFCNLHMVQLENLKLADQPLLEALETAKKNLLGLSDAKSSMQAKIHQAALGDVLAKVGG
eukprot:Skav236213  [mRNA]  locus=scaffold98:251964:258203:- [translate_table: standard]